MEKGVQTLQLLLAGDPVVVLAAESRGRSSKAGFVVQLAPLDPSHIPELQAIVNAGDEPPPASGGPMSASMSALPDSQAAVPAGGRAFAKTLRDPDSIRELPEEDEEQTDPYNEGMLGADVVGRAPPPADASRDDTLTMPARPSAVPPPAGGHAPRNDVDPDALSTVRSASSPLVAGMSEARPTAPQRSPPASSVAPATPDQDHTLIPVEHGDPITSQSNFHTLRTDAESAWGDDEDDVDPSSVGSVVIDPDILARETRHSSPPPAPAPPPMLDPPREAREARREQAHAPPLAGARIPSHMPKPGQSSARAKAGPPDSGAHTPPPTIGAVSTPRTQKRNTAQMVTGGRIIANRYRIETLVGAGAVGAVFKATHVDLPRVFAIKLLHPHYRADPHLMASFRAEARAASLLDHPNVTVVHDFGEEPDGLVYIVMEYLQGINLQALLNDERRLSPRRAIEIMLQVCGALSAAHERGVVHRDVKPDNIMLVPTRNDEGEMYDLVKVCDFGIAALETAPGAEDGEITAGTPEYMAPEQAAGRADARTDVYACGIVLYEILVGKPPFVGETPVGTLAKHAKERAKRPSEIVAGFPAALEAIIMRAIEKQPERRFQTMRELRVELKRLL